MIDAFCQSAKECYENERIEELKGILQSRIRNLKKLNAELKVLKDTVQEQTGNLEAVNKLLASKKSSPITTNENSAIFRALKETKKQSNEHIVSYNIAPPSFYIPNTNQIIDGLQNMTEFDDFFYEFPLGFFALLYQYELPYDPGPITTLVETWPYEKRTLFYSAFFDHIHNVAFLFQKFMKLVDNENISTLTDQIESQFPEFLNYQRISFFIYNEETHHLTMEKQKLTFTLNITDGLIYQALTNKEIIYVAKNQPGYTHSEDLFMKDNTSFLAAPVLSNNHTIAIVILADKTGGIRQSDFIVANALTRFIAETIPVILQHNERTLRINLFQNTFQSFLELVSAREMPSFLNILPKIFTSQFQCESIALFKVSLKKHYYYLYGPPKSERITYPIDIGIVGRVIRQRRAMTVTLPEFSVLFQKDVDRGENSNYSKSIIVCPILNQKQEPTWAIVLYNKTTIETFTDNDLQTAQLICKYLDPILGSVLETEKIVSHIEQTKHQMRTYGAILELLTEIPDLSNISYVSSIITERVSETLNGRPARLFYVDRFRHTIHSTERPLEYEANVTEDTNDPIPMFAARNEVKQTVKSDNQPEIVYCSIADNEDESLGLLKLYEGHESSSKLFNTSSMFQSSLSIFNSSSKNAFQVSALNKSQVKLKLEQLNQISTSHYQNVTSQSLTDILKVWGQVISYVMESSLSSKLTSNRYIYIQTSIAYESEQTSSPEILLSIFKEMAIFNDNLSIFDNGGNQYEDDQFSFPILPKKNPKFIRATVDLLTKLQQFTTLAQTDDNEIEMEPPSIKDYQTSDLFTNNFNVFDAKLDELIYSLIKFMDELNISNYLGIEQDGLIHFLICLRSFHPASKFKNWELAVDHCQFLCYLLKTFHPLKPFFSDSIVTALFFYLLSIYAIPNTSTFAKIRLCIENGTTISPIGIVYSAFRNANIRQLPNEMEIYDVMKDLGQSQQAEFFTGGNIVFAVCTLCQFSYLSRSFDIATKWINTRFEEEIHETDFDLFKEIKNYQIEFEARTFILPLFGELVKKGCIVEPIRKIFIQNATKISGASL